MAVDQKDQALADRGGLPGPDTLVLLNRKLKPGTADTELSRFRDDRWKLSPAIFESHLRAVSLNFELVPEQFRYVAKVFIWLELNHDDNDLPVLRRASVTGRLAAYSMLGHLRNVRALLDWLVINGIPSLADVTAENLDSYLETVIDSERTHGHQSDLLQAVRRLWAFRQLLPEEGRLPEAPPWGGKSTRVLLGKSDRNLENLTLRIQETTMAMTLVWALRFVEDFAPDILAATAEFRPLFGLAPGRYRTQPQRRARTGAVGASAEIAALVTEYRDSGRPLPGKRNELGELEPNWHFIAKLLDFSPDALKYRYRSVFLESGLPIAEAAFLRTCPTAVLDDRPWLDGFRDVEMRRLVRVLSAACFVLVSYLTGMRPGEALSLRRGCVSQDPRTKLWLIAGSKWKGATAADGSKIPEGEVREEPWVTIEVVAKAIQVLEQLHDSDLLFPSTILPQKSGPPLRTAQSHAAVNEELNRFVEWVNEYCAQYGREDVIPLDATALSASRFRRTLAWFICRRPRGLVAAAVQYGHLHVQITQGYGGTYASGFPDDLAFEKWLARLDDLNEADRRLKEGEHVSGPAAGVYRARVGGGVEKFRGRVLRSSREARQIMKNPSLQIYPGRAMTCVFSAATALCELQPALDAARYTPNTEDCRLNCGNLARTEENINEVRTEVEQLQRIVDDEASPPIRLERERRRLAALTRAVEQHEASRPKKERSETGGECEAPQVLRRSYAGCGSRLRAA